MTNEEFLEKHSFFYASNDEKLEWAKSHSDLVSLSEVLKGLREETNITPDSDFLFVPRFYLSLKRKELLPLLIWRFMCWKIREMKVGDLVTVALINNRDKNLVEVLARVKALHEKCVEVVILTTHQIIYVNREDIREYNQD